MLVLSGLVVTGPLVAPGLAAGPGVLRAPSAPSSHAVPASVRVAGVRVGGLDPALAARTVRVAFAAPLPVFVDGTRVELHPAKLATAYVAAAIGRARSASPHTNVHLAVAVHGAAVRAVVARLARRFDAPGKNARLAMHQETARFVPAFSGRRLDQGALVARVVRALNANVRSPVHAATRVVAAARGPLVAGSVILINRAKNQLFLFAGTHLERTFPVATGQVIYPTPTGKFQIIVKRENPWWYPPTQDAWAKGLEPVPPGPSNPLGTRWMGLSSPGIGIHGTDEPSSIGYSASHGCIRMQVTDAEWLFDHVGVGTTVFIV